MFEGENDRVKLMLLYSGDEEDGRLVRAASGCLAMLSGNPLICKKITTVCNIVKIESHSLAFNCLLLNK